MLLTNAPARERERARVCACLRASCQQRQRTSSYNWASAHAHTAVRMLQSNKSFKYTNSLCLACWLAAMRCVRHAAAANKREGTLALLLPLAKIFAMERDDAHARTHTAIPISRRALTRAGMRLRWNCLCNRFAPVAVERVLCGCVCACACFLNRVRDTRICIYSLRQKSFSPGWKTFVLANCNKFLYKKRTCLVYENNFNISMYSQTFVLL